MKEWIVIANRSEAKIFLRENKNQSLHCMTTLVDKKGRRHESAFQTDKPGMGFAPGRSRVGPHALDSSFHHLEAEAEKFARVIVRALRSGQDRGQFQRLTIFAEPRFMGHLKAFAQDGLKAENILWITKDLHASNSERILREIS